MLTAQKCAGFNAAESQDEGHGFSRAVRCGTE
jgi:hypothetical protein